MRYLVLACDYDGTIATHGQVDDATLAALARCRQSGRQLVLVTGRELPELKTVFPHLDLFAWVVAENGALLYCPASGVEQPLAEPPPPDFVAALASRGVAPMSVGRAIVATWQPHENTVMETIRDLGLEMQVIFNKGAVMILPSGVNKATGLAAALREMGISSHNVVAVGDAENDHALLAMCEASVAVANALAFLKERADLVTASDHGAGVTELINMLLADDLAQLEPRLARHHVLLGSDSEQNEVRVPCYGAWVLALACGNDTIASLTRMFLEQLAAAKYQFCALEGEAPLCKLTGALALGTDEEPPDPMQVAELLAQPKQNVDANLHGIALDKRAQRSTAILSHLVELSARAGRPHWTVLGPRSNALSGLDHLRDGRRALPSLWLVQSDLQEMSANMLKQFNHFFSAGGEAADGVRQFAARLGVQPPGMPDVPIQPDEVLYWQPQSPHAPQRFQLKTSTALSPRT